MTDADPGQVILRPLESTDNEFLLAATLLNMNWCGGRFTERDIRADPKLRHYCSFQPGRGDFGFVTEVAGNSVGVVWLLFLGEDDPGFGYISAEVPELSVCVIPAWLGRGLGSRLIMRALAEAKNRGLRNVSLSVEDENPARHLYERLGFHAPDPDADDGTMIISL